MDELLQQLCNGIGNALGTVTFNFFFKFLFTKRGFITIVFLGGGILFLNYSWIQPIQSKERSIAEVQARSVVETQCRSTWQLYYKSGKMYSTKQALGNINNYKFEAVPTGYYNSSIISAQSIKSDSSNFVGMVFAPNGNLSYSCVICKSNNYSNKNTSPVLTKNYTFD